MKGLQRENISNLHVWLISSPFVYDPALRIHHVCLTVPNLIKGTIIISVESVWFQSHVTMFDVLHNVQ